MIWRIHGRTERKKKKRWKVEHTRIKLSKLSSKSVGLRVINIEHHWQWCSWENILHTFGVAHFIFHIRKIGLHNAIAFNISLQEEKNARKIRIKIKRFPMFKSELIPFLEFKHMTFDKTTRILWWNDGFQTNSHASKLYCLGNINPTWLHYWLTHAHTLCVCVYDTNSNHFASRQKRHSIKICGNASEKRSDIETGT